MFTFDEIERVDFSDPEARRAEMNAFVKENTQNKIDELLPADSIQNSGNVFLINAASFKATLEKPFDAENTEYQYFYGDREEMVEMMNAIGMYNYGVFMLQLALNLF